MRSPPDIARYAKGQSMAALYIHKKKIERDGVWYRFYYVEILHINPPQNKYTRYTRANSAT
jgi:hypothetical protein